jgi:hypothetical protein
MKPHVSPTSKAASQRPAPGRLSAQALASQTIPSSQAAAIRGGDDTSALYPWIDKP